MRHDVSHGDAKGIRVSARRVGAFLAAVAVWCVAMLLGSLLPVELYRSFIAALAVSLFAAYIASYVTFGLSARAAPSASLGFGIAACVVGLALARIIAEPSVSSLLAVPGSGSSAQIAGSLLLAWVAPLLVVLVVHRVEAARVARREETPA